jgi:flagellar basal body-associated protein FliL
VKKKDLIQLAVALVIFIAAGFMIYLVAGPKKTASSASKQATIEVVTPIQPSYDQSALTQLNSAHDFYTAPNLTTGLGNNQLFGSQ